MLSSSTRTGLSQPSATGDPVEKRLSEAQTSGSALYSTLYNTSPAPRAAVRVLATT